MASLGRPVQAGVASRCGCDEVRALDTPAQPASGNPGLTSAPDREPQEPQRHIQPPQPEHGRYDECGEVFVPAVSRDERQYRQDGGRNPEQESADEPPS